VADLSAGYPRRSRKDLLSILQNRIQSGLLLFDEPEAALSPQRQLALLAHMSALVAAGNSQFIVATHSPILLTFPGAQILSFDGDTLHPIVLADTSHFQITKGILQNPNAYWKHLQEAGASVEDESVDAAPRKSKIRGNRDRSASEG
jgi:predicted ATPase